MITLYAPGEKQVVNYSSIIDVALLKLRKELRTDLSQIITIEWDKDDTHIAVDTEK